jgi:hypothetical protein
MKISLKKQLSISLLASMGMLLGSVFYIPQAANAIDSSAVGFVAGNIIDDYTLTNKDTMSVSQIQNFLNSNVPTCDTNGTQTSEYGGGTRAQWAANQSLHPNIPAFYPPFTCLKDYSQNGSSAAQIIYNIAQSYNINPQALLVVLQKEQGLVTDTWPGPHQYKTATGYGCPDTAACDSQYFGFTNQVTNTAKMFHAIEIASPTWSTPYILGNNTIQYNPTASCGSSVVNIQNRATQALYNYTPYQPNDATLNAPMGTTVSCGAYGNLNFYRYFTQWFGSTHTQFSPLATPRWMQLKTDSYKQNIATGENVEGVLAQGTQVLFTTKITVNGVTYLRTEHDTSGGLTQGVNITNLEEIPYSPMGYPRWMQLNRNAYKQVPRTGYNVDGLLSKNLQILFTSKIVINGQTYLKTSHDDTSGADKAIPMSFLSEISYQPLAVPRWMQVDGAAVSTDPLTSQRSDTQLPTNQQIEFTSKIDINGVTYLRSAADTTAGTSRAIPIGNTSNLQFVPLQQPRTMQLNKASTKYNTNTATPIDFNLSQGQQVMFTTKIFVNGQWYLRSKVDTNNNINYGVPLADLEDVS